MKKPINKRFRMMGHLGTGLLLGAVALVILSIIPPPEQNLAVNFNHLSLQLPGGTGGLPVGYALTATWPRWLRPGGRGQILLQVTPTAERTHWPDARDTHAAWLAATDFSGLAGLLPPGEQAQPLADGGSTTFIWQVQLPAEGVLNARLLLILRFVPHDPAVPLAENPLWAREIVIERGQGLNGLSLALLRRMALLCGVTSGALLGRVVYLRRAAESTVQSTP